MSDRIAAYEIEARLLRWGDSSTAGRTITLELDDIDAGEAHPFKHYATGAKHGQRFKLLFAPIGDDEQPIAHESPAPAVDSGPSTAPSFPKDAGALPARDTVKSERAKAQFAALSPMKQDVARASMMVNDDETFQAWLMGPGAFAHAAPQNRAARADNKLKARLYIASKADIGESRDVNERWHTLLTTYLRDTGQLAEIRS